MSDAGAVKRRSERCMELAGMLKEKYKGTTKERKILLAKFRLQEGISTKISNQYMRDLVDSGLIIVSKGNKSWKYNPAAEWDLFRIEI